ncbi:MAG: ornithine carbamoyltransferase, partial [Alphaproteobacteria bacterium]|nr:ornithine carbamoyltransferase [Alphaproteobacteria bacterium]
QIMADILTFEERKGSIKDRKVAWIGDGNNVANSWVQAAARFGFSLSLACPEPYHPCAEDIGWAKRQGADVTVTADPLEAVKDADLVTTDTWISMGAEDVAARKAALATFQVNAGLMQKATKDAVFLHCLPAVRGEEVTADVIDGPQSAIFDEAENRLHVQKSILLWCLTASTDHGK